MKYLCIWSAEEPLGVRVFDGGSLLWRWREMRMEGENLFGKCRLGKTTFKVPYDDEDFIRSRDWSIQ